MRLALCWNSRLASGDVFGFATAGKPDCYKRPSNVACKPDNKKPGIRRAFEFRYTQPVLSTADIANRTPRGFQQR